MPLYDGMQHGRGFNPFVQLPAYGEVIDPGGLSTYAAFGQAASKASASSSNKSSSETESGSTYVPGMWGEQRQQQMMYTTIDQQLNKLSQKASEDYGKYGSVERWRNSEEGKDFFRKANYLQAQRQEVNNNLRVLNYNQKQHKEKAQRVSDNGLEGLYFLQRDGKGFIPQFGGSNGIMTNGEYLTALYESGNPGVNDKSTQMSIRDFSEVKSDDYKGHFDVFARGWFSDAQQSMKKGGPGFSVVNEQGQVKSGVSPSDAVGFLLKTQNSSNYTAVNNVSAYLYDALDENARYDLAQQFYQDIIGGHSDAINALRTNKETAPLIDQIEKSIIQGKPVEVKEGEPNAWGRGNIEGLLATYGAIRIGQMANTYVKTDVDATMGGKIWDVGADQVGQVPITAEQGADAAKWLVTQPTVATSFFEANADNNSTYNNVTTDSHGNSIIEYIGIWDSALKNAADKEFEPYQNADGELRYVTPAEFAPMAGGYRTANGIVMKAGEGTYIVESGGQSRYAPAFVRDPRSGDLRNVVVGNGNDIRYTVYNDAILFTPDNKDPKTLTMVPAENESASANKFSVKQVDVEDLDPASLEAQGIWKGTHNGESGYFQRVSYVAPPKWANSGKNSPHDNNMVRVKGSSGTSGTSAGSYLNQQRNAR